MSADKIDAQLNELVSGGKSNLKGLFPKGYLVRELLVRILLSISYLLIYFFIPATKRRIPPETWHNYRYPFAKKETVPALVAAGILAVSPVLILTFVLWVNRHRRTKRQQVRDAVVFILAFTLSELITVLICETIKRLYGRLRPDFLSRCFQTDDPVRLIEISKTLTTDIQPECPGVAEHILTDGRMSFPSSHSSTAFAAFAFMALWANALIKRVPNYGAEALAVPAVILMAPLVISVTRTMDYRHHATDVLAGITIGAAVAVIVKRLYYPRLTKQASSTLPEAAIPRAAEDYGTAP